MPTLLLCSFSFFLVGSHQQDNVYTAGQCSYVLYLVKSVVGSCCDGKGKPGDRRDEMKRTENSVVKYRNTCSR